MSQRLAAVEQVQHGIAVVAHQHQGPMGQPAAQLQYHLPRPVGELFVAAPLLAVVPRRGRQHREHRQGPMATGPGYVAQPHQGDPAQAASLDQLLTTGTHRVAVDAPRPDFGAATPFQGLVDAEHQRALAPVQMLEQQRQQDAGRRTGRPHRPVEHLVVTDVAPLVAASHDAERRGNRALARGQYRADQQPLGFPPSLSSAPTGGRAAKHRCEGNENGYNGIGQGEQGWTFREKWGQAILPCIYDFSKLCVKSSKVESQVVPLPVIASVALKFVLPQIPALIRASAQAYDKIRNRKRFQKSDSSVYSDSIRALRTAVDEIEERLETQEAVTESQAELIVQLTRNNAVLGRWLLLMSVGLALSGGLAIAALLLTFLD